MIEIDFEDTLYNLQQSTRRNYLSRLKHYKLWCETRDVPESQNSAIRFAETYKSRASSNQVIVILKKYLLYKGMEVDRMKPFRVADRPKPHLDEKQLHVLLSTRLGTPKDLRNILMFRFMAYGGLRESEVVGLYLVDVDLVNKSVKIHGLHVKGAKGRVAYVDDDTIKLVKMYVSREKMEKNDLLFPITTSAVRKILKRYIKKAGLPLEISPHRLRDTFAIRFINKGGDITKLSRIMGHSKIETTMIYLKYSNKDLQDEHQKVFG